jgi:hypothetical protein
VDRVSAEAFGDAPAKKSPIAKVRKGRNNFAFIQGFIRGVTFVGRPEPIAPPKIPVTNGSLFEVRGRHLAGSKFESNGKGEKVINRKGRTVSGCGNEERAVIRQCQSDGGLGLEQGRDGD